jgi:NAD-reducing hydrogenase large subunit
MNRGLLQVAQRFIDGTTLTDGAVNRLQAVIRAFDPCLSCSTHALRGDGIPMVRLLAADGRLMDEK